MKHEINWTRVALFALLLYLFIMLHAVFIYVAMTKTVDGEVIQKLSDIEKYMEKYQRK